MTPPRKSTFIVLGCLAGLLLLVAVTGSQFSLGKHSSLTCIIEDTRTGGGAGVFAWANRMGIDAVPLRTPLWEIGDELEGQGHCVITAGDRNWAAAHSSSFQQEHWKRLHDWVASGNTLIAITNRSSSLPYQMIEEFTQSTDADNPVELRNAARNSSFSKEEELRIPTWWGGEMAVQMKSGSLVNYPSELRLAGIGDKTILAKRPLGEGNLYLLMDGTAWTNERFDQADNAATLARILNDSLSENGVLTIDEYRHGYGRVESFVTFLVALPGAASFLWMSLIWGLFWMVSRMKRLSPVEPFIDEPRRTAFEFIQSMASLNQRARAAPLAVNAVAQRVRYLLHKRGQLTEANMASLDRATQSVASEPRPTVPRAEIQIVKELIQLRTANLTGTDPLAETEF
ncbi:MAG TPA: DUF4350 domain-containing protein [Planctomicrobium sp.]|nr:DUF4350 domain-containing protein [Planctomicrobium sp.]